MEQTPSSSERVARGFRGGEARCVELVRERVCRILSFKGFGIPRVERRDLEQEVMMQLWRAATAPGFDVRGGFWGFVERVSALRCVDWYRRQRAREELDEGLEDGRRDPFARALERERRALADRVLDELGDRCRELIRLRIRRGETFTEISQRLGKSPGALRVQYHRCVREARRRIRRLERGIGDAAEAAAGETRS